MSKIIKIKKYKSTEEYQSVLTSAIEKLESIEDDLHSLIVNLATIGKWKEWSDSKQEGDTFKFTEEMLKDTGDSNVDSIAYLLDESIKVRKLLI